MDGGDESSRSSLSVLVFFLFLRSHSLGQTSLGLKSDFSLGSVVFVGLLIHSSNNSSIWVQDFHSGVVLQWVLLLDRVKSLVILLVSDGRLDGVGVDDLGDISVGEDSSVEMISSLFLSSESV
jgi:hypothetical protein